MVQSTDCENLKCRSLTHQTLYHFAAGRDNVMTERNFNISYFIAKNFILKLFLLFMAGFLSACLQGTSIVQIFRYVDDYFVIFTCDSDEFSLHVTRVLAPLDLTYKIPP